MSELQRSFAKAKLAGLPFDPPLPLNDIPDGHSVQLTEENGEEDEETGDLTPLREQQQQQDDDSSSASSASSASSTGTIKPSPSKHLFARPRGAPMAKKSFDPLPWNDYFSEELYLKIDQASQPVTFHVYINPPRDKGPLLVCHHGAGSSGLSFALFASEMSKLLPNYGVLSLDARGHGETVVNSSSTRSDDGDVALTLATLSQDLVDVLHLTKKELNWADFPDLVLIGHSLGGAVVTDVAKNGLLGDSVLAYAVLDVVEGSALDALQSMQQYLATRPSSFTSIQNAIEWHTRSRTIRSLMSARISVPPLIVRDSSPSTSTPASKGWNWRTDLSRTESYWPDWFTHLSSNFLSARGAKLLILAGTDRLDKELMIGQMQGKYQLQVVPEAGHFVHEDCAEKCAGIVAEFVKRNERGTLVLPPKVGSMPQQAKS